MPSFAIPLWDIPSLPVSGSTARFPVGRIFCVGRNYAEHAREFGYDPDREPPFFFTKPADSIATGAGPVPYPPATEDLHPELELVVALSGGGRDIPADRALDQVYGYAVGLDLTRRDMQAEAKEMRRPWALAKGFDHAAPCAAIHPATAVGHIGTGAIRLVVNGETRQDSVLEKMIWNVPDTIAFLSRLITLKPGDLIFTGTPEGVATIRRGDRLVGQIDGLTDIDVTIV